MVMGKPEESFMATGPYVLTEQQVALRLGVPTEWVRQHRGPRGQLWERVERGPILWSESGASELEKALAAENAPGTAREALPAVTTLASPEKAPSASGGPVAAKNAAGVEVLVVRRVGFTNRRILHASPENAPGVVTVWVQDSNRFELGLEILGRPWPGRPGVFTYAGNPKNPAAGPREPRRKGVW